MLAPSNPAARRTNIEYVTQTLPAHRSLLRPLALIGGGFLVLRGITALLVLDYGNPASYRDDWGGPSLLGVLAVDAGPALLVVAGFVLHRLRVQRRGRRRLAG